MSQEKSDYKLSYANVNDKLPAVLQNPLTEAIAETTYNRFFTKPELTRVIGTIGHTRTSNNLQLEESSVYDRAYQLQPIIKNTASTETKITTYKDLLRVCEQLGIDPARVQQWQNTQQFNFAVPINIDKLLNYTEYFWAGDTVPQYIVIESVHSKLQSQLTQMVTHYLESTNALRIQLWGTIKHQLDIINTVVPVANIITVRDLDLVLNDTANHIPYVFAPISNPEDYQVTNDWESENRWFHRVDIADISSVKQAKAPIIEYNSTIDLTQWTYTEAVWKYRPSAAYPWTDTTVGPTRDEIFTSYAIIGISKDDDTFTIGGNHLTQFVSGFKFVIENSTTANGKWTTINSYLNGNGDTVVHVNGNVITNVPDGIIIPFTLSSKGDEWKGFFEHWLYVGVKTATSTTAPVLSSLSNTRVTVVATEGQTQFSLGSVYNIVGDNVLRVYVNGRRQYGTYTEQPLHKINFLTGLHAGDVVTMYPYAAAADDFNKELVRVRVSPDALVLDYKCLVQYRLEEQYRTINNQYPLFNLVSIDNQPTGETSSIFSFLEDSSASVNTTLGKRVVIDATSKDFSYKIELVNDDGTLNFYRDSVRGATSIWRKDDTLAQYVPVKVNQYREPDPISPDAVYEIPKQLMSNVHHETRNVLKNSELFLHFKSIVDNQAMVDPFKYGTQLTANGSYRLNDYINYGAGGTIKEFNYEFDNFLSTLISSIHTIPDIISFAEDQYANLLADVREYAESNIVALLSTTDPMAIYDFPKYVVTGYLDSIKADTNASKLYGDSSVSTKTAIANWIATLPFLFMAKAILPELLKDVRLGLEKLIHHDGHFGLDELNINTGDVATNRIISAYNLYPNRVSQPKPTNPDVGALWYNATNGKIYRFNVAAKQVNPPTNLPNGALWWKSDTILIYRRSASSWVLSSNTIASSWSEFNLHDYVVKCLFNIETELYNGSKNNLPLSTAPIDGMMNTPAFTEAMRIEFNNYCTQRNILTPEQGDYNIANPFTWNYSTLNVGGMTGVARWYDIYQALYGTAYPHLQPWKLQGYTTIPVWWNAFYKGTTRRWSNAMWANIIQGVVPAGNALPNGTISTGAAGQVTPIPKTSVNITDTDTPDGIESDGMFPPYWVSTGAAFKDQVLLSPVIGSPDDLNIIASTKTNVYPFGTNGPNEYKWRTSVSYGYARARALFRIDPIRFVHYTFGEKFTESQGLFVSNRTGKVLSHRDVVFHGDVDEFGNAYHFDGINQWYVHFFRANALDLNGSEFKRAWTTWDTRLGYDIGSFVVDKTMSVDSTQFEITPNDYEIGVKKVVQVRDVWLDALYLSIYQAGSYNELPLGAGRNWKFSLTTKCPVAREYSYYGVKKYRITANANNTFDMVEGGFSLAGWETGHAIMFDTGVNGLLPSAIDNITYYFLIRVSDTKFMIADSKINAELGNNIPLGSLGDGIFYVAELTSTYLALEGKNTPILWKHYTINKNDIKHFFSGFVVTGIQNVADVIDGYVAYMNDQGFVFNDNSVQEYDASNNRLLNWQYVIESMIDQLVLTAGSKHGGNNTVAQRLGTLELNPFANNLWISHEAGVLSEFNTNDVRSASAQPVIYDRTGKRINNRHFHVLRQDKMTHLAAVGQNFDAIITSDFNTITFGENSFSGVHAFFDEYDNVLMFNPYTISGDLMYDSFLGIAVPKVHLYFEKQANATKRPNVGGFVYNQGKLTQNYEYTVGNVLKYYDTFTVNENADFVNEARKLLGYAPNASYLQSTNVSPKSQFLFYKGMIKAKGTQGSVKAFTNTRHFSASEMDEFWAYRAYDFGDNRTKLTYYMNMISEDTIRNHSKLQFTNDVEDPVDPLFTRIALNDISRWSNYPSQYSRTGSGQADIFELKADRTYQVIPTTIFYNGIIKRAIIHKLSDSITMYQQPKGTKTTYFAGNGLLTLNHNYVTQADALTVYKNGVITSDYVESTNTTIQLTGSYLSSDVIVIIPKVATLRENIHYTRLNSRVVLPMIDDLTDMTLVTYKAAYDKFAPIKLYDGKSEVVVKDLTPWDPQQGFHQPQLAALVDVFSDTDPAKYNASPCLTENTTTFWATPEVDTIWVDQSSFEYVQYSDITLDADDKLRLWGTVAEWSDPAVYRWVASSKTPAAYLASQGTAGITGTPKVVAYKRTRNQVVATLSGDTWTTQGPHGFSVNDEIIFSTDGTLPTPLATKTIYVVAATATSNSFTIVDRDGTAIDLLDIGMGSFVVNKAYYGDDWKPIIRIVEHHEGLEVNTINYTLNTSMPLGEEYSMFFNGKFMQDGGVPDNGVIEFEPSTIQAFGNIPANIHITIINKTGIIDGATSVQPDYLDVTDSVFQTYVDTPVAKVDHINEVTGITEPIYYFWVRDNQNPISGDTPITTNSLESMLVLNYDAYMFCMKPSGILDKTYSQLILGGIAGTVSEPDRYTLRLTKDHTLRDTLRDDSGIIVKPRYAEWIMFREKQNQTIDRALWNMVTESIIGYSLIDSNVLIPSTDRAVYDNVNGTKTRYGMERGQAFVDGPSALKTLLSVLNSAEIDYNPIDVDYFLETHDTTTNAGVTQFMADIYNTFPAKYVNGLFFAVMMDALTNVGVDYSAFLMKTSAISLSGVASLNVNGEFDE